MQLGKKHLIRIGVAGLGRGSFFIGDTAKAPGLELVSLCDTREKELKKFTRENKVGAYTSYEKFLEHDMDAVILANYFHEHAPFGSPSAESLRSALHTPGGATQTSTPITNSGPTAWNFPSNFILSPDWAAGRCSSVSGGLARGRPVSFQYSEFNIRN
jgi:hypothetical protein